MSILQVEIPREVIGYFQHGAGDIDTAKAAKTGGGSVVLMQAEAQNVRYRLDGTDPTAAVGHLLLANNSVTINIGDNKGLAIRVIAAAAGAILNVTSFR